TLSRRCRPPREQQHGPGPKPRALWARWQATRRLPAPVCGTPGGGGERLASVGAMHYLDDPVVAAGREAGDPARRPGAVGRRAHDDDHAVPGADNLDELKPAA